MLDKKIEHALVFIDGVFSVNESSIPEGVICLPLDIAIQSYGVFLQKKQVQGKNGAFLYIPPNTKIFKTIQIEYIGSGNSHLIISLGKNAEAKLEQNVSRGTISIDVSLDRLANLEMKNIQIKEELSQTFKASLKRDCRFALRQYLTRAQTSIQIDLLEENGEVLLEGVTKLEAFKSDIDVLVNHLAPHTRSRQHFKALVSGKSRSSFKGTIYVDPIAQKTEGYQLSNNLLLSDEATAYVQPNLEIFADDVKASHGATVTQIDKESLFYLTSRGVSKEDAKDYLVKGFIQELSACLP